MALNSGRTTAPAYVSNVTDIDPVTGTDPQYNIIPLLTVGDEVPLLQGDFGNFTTSADKTFAMAGIPDGLGISETEDGYYVWMNHELAATEEVEDPATGGSTPSNQGDVPQTDVIEVPITSDISSTVDGQIQGSRVSLWQFDKDWNAIGGKNLIDTVVDSTGTYELNLDTGEYVSTEPNSDATLSFSRFCSGYLADSGFVGGPVWFAPEESGDSGRGFAVTPDGTAQSIEGLGRYSKENVVSASQYRADNSEQTVLISTEDYADGEVYMYVGQQTEEDPNGFENGDLYVLRVDGYDFETIPEGESFKATWTPVPEDIALNPDGTVLSNWVNAEDHSTNFQRPEDIAEDPNNPGSFYFATTGTQEKPGGDVEDEADNAATPEEAANPYGKLYHLSLNPDDPTAPVEDFKMVHEGGFGNGVSYDNITVDSNGNVLIQEDETAFGGDVMKAENRDAGIWSYNIDSDEATFITKLDESAAGAQFNDPQEPGEWESSGIIEVDPGESSYLFDVQAHTVEDPDVLGGNYAEGGQLILAQPTGERQVGSPEADQLNASLADIVYGIDGDDLIDAFASDDNQLYGGAGNDEIIVGGSNIQAFGARGDDLIDASADSGNNRLVGGVGKDEIIVGSNDQVLGAKGDDLIDASAGGGNNRLYGGAGDDEIIVGSNDQAFGARGDDRFFVGSSGDNQLTGGEGADAFWIASAELPDGSNTITDFDSGMDVLGIGGLGISFADLSLSQDGSDAVISALGQDLAVLNNIQSSALSAADFVFA